MLIFQFFIRGYFMSLHTWLSTLIPPTAAAILDASSADATAGNDDITRFSGRSE
jgi:hypothetical protein